jgi:hypothetical protein
MASTRRPSTNTKRGSKSSSGRRGTAKSSSSSGGRSTAASRPTVSRRGSPRGRSRAQSGNSSDGRSKSTQRQGKDLPDYSVIDPHDIDEAVDVYVDAPVVKVDEIKFELDDFRAHLAVLAEAGHFVQLNAGVGVRLGKVELDIQGVETQALMEVRLHNVTRVLGRVLTTLDRNPELLKSVGDALGDVGGGAHDLLTDTGDTIKSAQSAVADLGQGAGEGVAGIGSGAEQGVAGLGQGAQQGVQALGQGAQQGVQGVGQGAGQELQDLGQGGQQQQQGQQQGGESQEGG